MILSREEVDHIALLARLDLSAEEKQRYQQQLSDILDFVAQLQKLDTDNITLASSVLPPRTILREDVPVDGLTPKQALANAPDKDNSQFKVPPVLD